LEYFHVACRCSCDKCGSQHFSNDLGRHSLPWSFWPAPDFDSDSDSGYASASASGSSGPGHSNVQSEIEKSKPKTNSMSRTCVCPLVCMCVCLWVSAVWDGLAYPWDGATQQDNEWSPAQWVEKCSLRLKTGYFLFALAVAGKRSSSISLTQTAGPGLQMQTKMWLSGSNGSRLR